MYKVEGDFNKLAARCRPVDFAVTDIVFKQTATNGGGKVDLTITISAHVCGPDPYAQPWIPQGKSTAVISGNGVSATKELPLQGNALKIPRGEPLIIPGIGISFQLFPGNPTMMEGNASIPGYTKATGIQVIVNEALSQCPISLS